MSRRDLSHEITCTNDPIWITHFNEEHPVIIDLIQFMMTRKKYWLLPALLALLILGTLIALSAGSALAPFIYTLF